MAKLSTHILDTAAGVPAAGVQIELFRLDLAGPNLLKTATSNSDGRTDEPLLDDTSIEVGEYEIRFHVADYFSTSETDPTKRPFLSVVPIRFAISDSSKNYHVPLLVSPWSYSTYRGS